MAGNDELSRDAWGAVTATLVALPSAIGFGLLIYAPLGPAHAAQGAIAGMFGAIAIGIVAPLFGGTPRLISGPCAPAAAVMSAFAVELITSSHGAPPRSPADVLALLTVVAAAAGGLQIVFGAVGGGRLIKYIPYPVVAGYLSGVGALILMSQVPKLLGVPGRTDILTALATPTAWQWPSVAVGIVTIAATVAAPRITRVAPPPVLGLACGGAAYLALSTVDPGLRTLEGNALVIGPVAGLGESAVATIAERWRAVIGLPADELRALLVPSLTLAVLLSIDTLKTCVLVDALTRSRHRSNRELVGQGLGNLAAAMTAGIPGAGQTGATVVNISAGGTTRRSGVLEGVFALAAVALFAPFIAWVPVAGLAGILIVVGSRMLDRNVLHLLRQRSTILDFGVVAAVVVTAVAGTLIAAAAVGVALAIILFVRDQIRGSVVRRRNTGDHVFSRRRRLPEETAILDKQGALTAIYELQGSLFFGTTDQLYSELEHDLKTERYVILDLRRVHAVDFTATHVLQQIEAELTSHGGVLIFSSLPPHLPTGQDLERYFDEVGLVRPSSNVKVFAELDGALEWTEEELLAAEQFPRLADQSPLALADIDVLRGASAEAVAALGGLVEERAFDAGERIFAQGDTGDELFLIRRGLVRILLPLADGRQHHLATFARGDFFGDMAFLDDAPRSADAVAATRADLYALSRARFDALGDERVERVVFARLARGLALRLRQTDAEVRALEES